MLLAVLATLAQAPPAPPPPRCRWEEKVDDTTVVHLGPERDCATWQPARAYRGVWRYLFEGSSFVADAHTLGEATSAGVWFSFDAKSGFPASCRPVLGHAYRIAFIGRSAVPRPRQSSLDGFGHMGMWPGEVLVDRVIAIEDLGEVPGPQVRPAGSPPPCVPLQER